MTTVINTRTTIRYVLVGHITHLALDAYLAYSAEYDREYPQSVFKSGVAPGLPVGLERGASGWQTHGGKPVRLTPAGDGWDVEVGVPGNRPAWMAGEGDSLEVGGLFIRRLYPDPWEGGWSQFTLSRVAHRADPVGGRLLTALPEAYDALIAAGYPEPYDLCNGVTWALERQGYGAE